MAQKKIDYDLEGALKAGLTESDISTYLKSKGHADTEISSLFMPNFSDVQSGSSTYQAPKSKGFLEQAADFRTQSQQRASQEYRGDRIADVLADLENITRTGAAGAVGGIGGLVAGPVGANVGFTATDEALRAVNQRPTGSFISGTQNPALATIENVAVGELGGRLISKGAALFKEAVKPGSIVGDTLAKIKPTFSGYFESAPIAKKLEETTLKGYNQAQKARVQESVQEEIRRFAQQENLPVRAAKGRFQSNQIEDLLRSSKEYDEVRNLLNPENVKQLQNVLDAGEIDLISRKNAEIKTITVPNLRQGLASFNTKQLLNNSADPITGQINAKQVADQLANPFNKKTFDKLYGATSKQRHIDFFQSMANATSPTGVYRSTMIDNVFKYGSTIGFIGGLGNAILSSSPSRALVPAGIAGVYILNKGSRVGLSAALNNPESARLLAAAAKGGALGMSHEAAARIISRELIGHKAIATTNDGQEIRGTFNKEGQFEVDN